MEQPATNEKRGNVTHNFGNQQNTGGKDDDFQDEDTTFLCNRKYCWWSPSQNSIAAHFCNETSIHGFRFIGQPKRHIAERIFWLIAFLLSLSIAAYVIYEVWDRYAQVPVIVSFQANEQNIDSIPFPAVTICNMNKFPRSKVRELTKISEQPNHEKYQEAKKQLRFVRSVCNAQQSFAKHVGFAFHRGTNDQEFDNDSISEENKDEMIDFLLDNTIPCEGLLRLCMLGDRQRNCSDLFKPIITDYGKCCTFNILPLPILLRNPQTYGKPGSTIYDNPVLGRDAELNWPMEEIVEWKKWKYETGFVLEESATRPWKQKRAGLPYGLSILVDPNIEEYYCPMSDSEGIRYILHTPLEMPHVMELASVAELDKEILIQVHPDMTNADNDIRFIEQYLTDGGQHYDSYQIVYLFTTVETVLMNALLWWWKTSVNAPLYLCRVMIMVAFVIMIRILETNTASSRLGGRLKDKCGHCYVLCEDVAYNYETTIAHLQNVKQLWQDPDHGSTVPSWANNRMAVIHIFIGRETTIPKYRKRLYGITDLIANTGGILGLCLGFSILSGVEVVYFIIVRSLWKCCRRRMIGRQMANKFVKAVMRKNTTRVIRVNPNIIPVYSGPGHYGRPDQPIGSQQQFLANI